MTVTVDESAREDVAQAVRFYNAKPDRHGAAFALTFEAAVERIMPMPRMFSRVEDAPAGYEVREVFIDRFRQRVLFNIAGEAVRVFAVVHASAGPHRWIPTLPPLPPE
jgi:plasmid stabilization system protein ParE